MAEPLTINVTRAAAPTPKRYTVPGAVDVEPLAAFASFDGSAAASSFLPCIAFYSAAGILIGRYYPSTSVPAGGSADVSFAPFLGGGGDLHYGTNTGGYLVIHTTENDPTTGDSILLDAFQDLEILVGRDVNLGSLTANDFNAILGNDINMQPHNDWNLVATRDVNEQSGRDMNLDSAEFAHLSGDNGGGRIDFRTSQHHSIAWKVGHDLEFRSGDALAGTVVLLTLDEQSATDVVRFTLRTGQRLLVQNEAGQGLFRVDETGDLHGLTGKALTFDL